MVNIIKAENEVLKNSIVNDSRLLLELRCNSIDSGNMVPRNIEEMDFVSESLQLEDSWRVEDEFMVAPFSFMSETVTHNGLKTWSEIKKTWKMWENRPVCFDHPQTEVVMDPEDVIGYIRNVEKNEEKKRLEAELWVLKERPSFTSSSDNYWKTMLEALKERDEISAGYYTIIEEGEGTFTDICGNEMEYEKRYTQILPDHIASVRRGACSPDQGCGVDLESITEDKSNFNPQRGSEVSEENDEGILRKIYGALNEVLHRDLQESEYEELDGNNTEEKEKDKMSEEENEESECDEYSESNSENRGNSKRIPSEETEQEERQSALEKELEQKNSELEDLQEKVSKLEEQVEEYREKEFDELVKQAVELTTMDEEAIRECDTFTVKTLIEGARSSRNAVTENERQESEDGGKNLRSPPGGSDDSGPEVVDVFTHPLDN